MLYKEVLVKDIMISLRKFYIIVLIMLNVFELLIKTFRTGFSTLNQVKILNYCSIYYVGYCVSRKVLFSLTTKFSNLFVGALREVTQKCNMRHNFIG